MSTDQKADKAGATGGEAQDAKARAARAKEYRKCIRPRMTREFVLAFVPINETTLGNEIGTTDRLGRAYRRGDYTIAGPPVLITGNETEAQQEQFYEALTQIPWLSTAVISAALAELGSTRRELGDVIAIGQSAVLSYLVDTIERRLWYSRDPRSYGSSLRDEAIQELADDLGMEFGTLRKRLTRHGFPQASKIDLWRKLYEEEERALKAAADGKTAKT